MKNSSFLLFGLICLCYPCLAQKTSSTKAGVKAGYNLNKLAGQPVNMNVHSKSGFMVSGFFSPSSKGLGYRSELVFSRQGFSYDDNGARQDVQTDYIYLPQLTTYSIGSFFQLQAGGQIGYLLKSSAMPHQPSSEKKDVTECMNRLDAGAAFGFEIYPVKHLIIGTRYNISFGNIYEQEPSAMASPLPFASSDIKGRNAVLQFFAGIRF